MIFGEAVAFYRVFVGCFRAVFPRFFLVMCDI